MAVRKISGRDDNGAVEFVCLSTDAIADWPDGCEAVCPEGYGAGSAMTIYDKTGAAPVVSGFGSFDGSDWATL